jgi:muramoyltetrapeptide carboxypeptidase
MTRIPPFLRKGDTILIIGTARARAPELIEPAVKILGRWGLKVEKGKNLFKRHHQFAGTDEERVEDLSWAVNHPSARAVLIAGGGYGAMKIIDHVNFKPLLRNPKWFVGYSDATVIHSRIINMGLACIHGTMAFQFGQHREATLSVKKLLFGEKISYKIPASSLNRSGKASGLIAGGNLSLLYALSGSRDELNTEKIILFIEDLDEQLYHIDRMVMQLKRSGKLKNLAGLIVGGMTEMKDNAIPYGKTAEEIILDAVKEYNYPVCFNFPSGHIPGNMAIYLGVKVRLEVKENSVSFQYQLS